MSTNRGRNALGKGLGALIPPPRFKHLSDDYFMCRVDKVSPDPNQPRQRFDDDRLAELVASIKEKGILQPIVVRKASDPPDAYIVVAGERRLRAARRAGLKEVPVLVKDVASDEALELALIENIQREDLNAIEEAEAYRRLLESKAYTQDVLARHLGKQRSTIANALRLLKLETEHQRLVIDGEISAGHARALLSIDDIDARRTLATRIVDRGLSVRDAERHAKRAKAPAAAPQPSPQSALQTYFARVSETLTEALGAPVTVKGRGRRGKVTVAFDDLETLARIATLLEAPAPTSSPTPTSEAAVPATDAVH